MVNVSNDKSDAGAAYGAGAGEATVSACAGAVCGSANVTVHPGLISIAVLPASPSVLAGLSVQLYAAGTYDDGTVQDITSLVSWSSSNTTLAQISNTGTRGVALGVAPGSVTITATAGSLSGTTTLTVNP